LIGKEIAKEEIKSILAGLEMEIAEESEEALVLYVPTYRVDVQRDVDVIEDILRIYGYNNVSPGTSLNSSIAYSSKPDSHQLQNLISEQLTGSGFNEILNNSLTKAAYYAETGAYPANRSVMILNPLSADLNCMRQTLLFGGLENIAYNINRKNGDIKFYEFGNCYYFDANKTSTQENPLTPYSENFHLGIWLSGYKTAQSWIQKQEKTSYYQLRAYVENVLTRLGINIRKTVYGAYTDELFSEGQTIYTPTGKQLAILGIVQRNQLKKFDIEEEVYFADLNWQSILSEIKRHKISYSEISKYPEVKRDLALLLDKNISFAEIAKIATETERKLLKDIYLFDVYEGKNLEAGKKSYAVSFILQDDAKTLTDSQIDAIMKKLIKNFEEKLGAKIR
jgi:phenylalanyl-tRNA synthetase beta chain